MCGRYTALTEDEVIEVREILKELSFRIVRDEFDEYNKEPVEFPQIMCLSLLRVTSELHLKTGNGVLRNGTVQV